MQERPEERRSSWSPQHAGGTNHFPIPLAEVDGNRTRRTGIARPTRFEGGGAHQVPRHLRPPRYPSPLRRSAAGDDPLTVSPSAVRVTASSFPLVDPWRASEEARVARRHRRVVGAVRAVPVRWQPRSGARPARSSAGRAGRHRGDGQRRTCLGRAGRPAGAPAVRARGGRAVAPGRPPGRPGWYPGRPRLTPGRRAAAGRLPGQHRRAARRARRALRHHPPLRAPPRPAGGLRRPRRPRERLAGAVRARRNIVVVGGTGSGKTTLLNALAGCIPPDRAHRHRGGHRRAGAASTPMSCGSRPAGPTATASARCRSGGW